MRLMTFLLTTLMVSACTSTNDLSGDVVMIGKDTYLLSGTSYSWKTHELALSASNFCRKEGKYLLLKSKESRKRRESDSTQDTLVFLCLKKDSPRYMEANPSDNPDIIIKQIK